MRSSSVILENYEIHRNMSKYANKHDEIGVF